MARKDEHKIQIGDTLYQCSTTYEKVFEWVVLDIWLENYASGNKTIVKCSNGSWTKEFFVVDVLHFYNTEKEAKEQLEFQMFKREFEKERQQCRMN